MMPKIVFIGTPEFGAIILEKLIANLYEPVLVITSPDKPVGRRQEMTPPPVKITAQKYNIPVEQPIKISSILYKVLSIKPDIIITAAYGQIIPKNILDIPKYGSLNVHPSLLPKYRGSSPIQSAILEGERETGVSIMLMDEKMDHGKIVSSVKYQVSSIDTCKSLSEKLANAGANLLLKTIPSWIKGEIKAKDQNHEEATFTKILKKEDGEIDWNESPEKIDRKIRAYNPWPGAFTFVQKNGKVLRVKILKAELSEGNLTIKKVQPEGKKEMDYEEYLKGHSKFF